MKKILFSLLLTVLIVSGCSTQELLGSFTDAVDPTDTTVIEVVIPSGSSTDAIAGILLENDLIRNKLAFKEFAKSLGADTAFQAGTYHLDKTMDAETIIAVITGGEVYVETVSFTIPEGFESRQIIVRLVEAGLATEEELIAALSPGAEYPYAFLDALDEWPPLLEGYLFPDTYVVRVGATAEEIVSVMLMRFSEVFGEEEFARLEEMGLSLNEAITLASIIEREGKLDEERPLISSVFYNRLEIGMRLQSCATVQYALGERKEILTYDDLEIDSPYNTYLVNGLPPAPIASPGEASIEAALYPADTGYFYFVTKETNDGSHYFNETYDEHNQDKDKK